MEKNAANIRTHWRVENCLHWVLDVVFAEDQCRIRTGYAAQSFATIRRLAINVIRNNKSRKGSARAKRLLAAWENDYLSPSHQDPKSPKPLDRSMMTRITAQNSSKIRTISDSIGVLLFR